MSKLKDDLDWLEAQHTRLWLPEKHSDLFRGRVIARESGERLTEDDLTKLFEVVLRHGLPVQMCNTSFGFGVGILVHEPEKAVPYPGTEDACRPDILLVVSQDQLPLSQSSFERKDRILFEDGWRVFSEITHSDRNRETLQRCGFDPPRSKGHYVY